MKEVSHNVFSMVSYGIHLVPYETFLVPAAEVMMHTVW